MLLAIDVGNTNIVLGIYDAADLLRTWRIRTDSRMTEDEFRVFTAHLFSEIGIDITKIQKVVVSSVVPPMAGIIDSFCRKYIGWHPYWVGPESFPHMPIRYMHPGQLGADRMVNAAAAFHKHRTSLIVIDFGTATTFDAVSDKGEYLGGAISPGIGISADALYAKASKLPRVELSHPPETVIGKDTIGSIRSGIIYGYAGLVDGMVGRMKKEMASNPKVIATGGLAQLMMNISETIESLEPNLTLEGLKLIGDAI
jgi:type III pantothenate kinase